jgi:hypothetical protein
MTSSTNKGRNPRAYPADPPNIPLTNRLAKRHSAMSAPHVDLPSADADRFKAKTLV